MRLVGLALLAGWLLAWFAAPHGEPAYSTSIVGAVAVAGGDPTAAAWLELRRGETNGILHVQVIRQGPETLAERLGDRLELEAGPEASGFRLADAGAGHFVLIAEHRTPETHWFEVHRFGGGRHEVLPSIPSSVERQAWEVAAAGDEVLLTEESGATTRVHTLAADGNWVSVDRQVRVLVGAGDGHTVRYEEHPGAALLTVAPERAAGWSATLARPTCPTVNVLSAATGGAAGSGASPRAPITVTSVIGMRGGYARLMRRGNEGCVEGISDGKPFVRRDLPLLGFGFPRLRLNESRRLEVVDEQAHLTQRRLVLPDDPGQPVLPVWPVWVDPRVVDTRLEDTGVRYRLFGGTWDGRVTDLATRVTDDEIQVVLEHPATGAVEVLAPTRRHHADHGPLLRQLVVLPLGFLLLGAIGVLGLLRRLAALRPSGALRVAGDATAVTIEGKLLIDAEAPHDGLRVRTAQGPVRLFIEGADVLRASQIRPRNQPRGDAIDVACGAHVVASGRIDPGALYREDSCLRAGPGDLVLVGCTLDEARARTRRRLVGSAALFMAALALVLSITLRF